jgi:hypothetical protein
MTHLRRAALAVLLTFLSASAAQAAGLQIGLDLGGKLLNYGSSASGAMVCSLDATGQSNLSSALATPNGGISTQATPDTGGNCNGATFTLAPTPTPGPTAATLAAGANAGSGAAAPSCVAGLTPPCNMQTGDLTITTGTSPTAGAMIVVTFPYALTGKPLPIVHAANAAAASCLPYVADTSISTTGLTISCATAPGAATALHFYYELEQR